MLRAGPGDKSPDMMAIKGVVCWYRAPSRCIDLVMKLWCCSQQS